MPKLYKAPFYTEEQVEVMEEKDVQFPFSSKYMKYDSEKQQYIPTEALLIKHGMNLSDFLEAQGRSNPTDINNELEHISDQIYTFSNKNSGSSGQTLKCIIAKGLRRGMSPYRFRLKFEEILWKQARFYLGNDDLTKQTGVDAEQKMYLHKGVFNEDRHIDQKVKVMLMDLGLCWTGSYDSMFMGIVNRQDW